jgi:hypothetical protein
MNNRESVSLSYCEKCGSKVSSRDEVCSSCGSLPYQYDKKVDLDFELPSDVHPDNWSEELLHKYSKWLELSHEVNFCKDCGMSVDEVQKFDFNDVIDENTGEVTSDNNHPCNPDSPIFE